MKCLRMYDWLDKAPWGGGGVLVLDKKSEPGCLLEIVTWLGESDGE